MKPTGGGPWVGRDAGADRAFGAARAGSYLEFLLRVLSRTALKPSAVSRPRTRLFLTTAGRRRDEVLQGPPTRAHSAGSFGVPRPRAPAANYQRRPQTCFLTGEGRAKPYRPAVCGNRPVRPERAPAGFCAGVGGSDRGGWQKEKPSPLAPAARPRIVVGFFPWVGRSASWANRSSETNCHRSRARLKLVAPRGGLNLWAFVSSETAPVPTSRARSKLEIQHWCLGKLRRS